LQLTKYYSGNKLKKKELGRARSKFRKKDRLYRILVEKSGGNKSLGILTDRRIILKRICKINRTQGMDWIDLD
jgi:hypothetical protein